LKYMLEKILTLLSAAVDVMSSNAWLSALGAMDLSQMCVQASWENDKHLKQIPHFEPDVVKRCVDAGVETVYDIMELDEERGKTLLQMSERQFKDVNAFLKSYPALELNYELVKGEYRAGSPIYLRVSLSQSEDEEEEVENNNNVVAPYYPFPKTVHWWLVVGQPGTRQLLAIKRITVKKSLTVTLDFTLPKGNHNLNLYLICDSYQGVDHELQLESLDVAEGEESGSDSDDDMEGSQSE